MSTDIIDRAVASPTRGERSDLPARYAKRARDLYVHAALGYALLALSEARSGRRAEAMAALDAADGLLLEFPPADSQLALRVQLAIARTAMIVGDAAMARRALRKSDQLRALAADTRAVQGGAGRGGPEPSPPVPRRALGAGLLTPAELRLLKLLPSHHTFSELAGTLYVSRNTIKTQASSLYRKLGVTSRSAAVDAARQLGFVDA